jgi:tetratricopeptide (TPR) repeat protein
MPKNRYWEKQVKKKKKAIKFAADISGKETDKKTIYGEQSRTIEWEKVTAAVAILYLIILGISSFFPAERLWGVNHLSYYSFWLRALLISLGILTFIPLVSRGTQKVLKKSVIPVFSFLIEKRKYLGYSIIISLFVLFFYLFRTKAHLLGDGASIISYMNSGTLSIKWTQPLGIWIYLSAYDLLNKFFHFDGAALFALISYLCGAVFIFFALRLTDLLGKITSTKLFVFLSLTFMGGTQLFLGYAEYYPLFYCGVLIYLFYSIKCLKGEIKVFLPLFTFFVLLPTHLFSIYLFPSVIFLFLSAEGEGKNKSVFKNKKIWIVSTVLILAFVSLILYFLKYGWYSSMYFVPLFKGRYWAPDHTLFSLPHLLDFLNQQLLISPIGFLLFLTFLILILIGAKHRSRHIGGEGLDSKDKIFQFLLIVSIAQLCFNFVIDPGLGAARDWDLFASVGLGYTVLALYIFGKLPTNSKLSHLKLGLTVIVLISTLSWMGINASAELSVRRFRNLLDLDPKRSLNGHYILADYFEALGKSEEVEREERMQVEKFPEASLVNGGLKSLEKGDLDNAYSKFTRALQIAPNSPEVHWALGEYYFKRENLEKAEVELMKTIDLRADHATAYALLGIIYSLKKDLKKARKMLERALVLGAGDKEVYHNLGNIYSLSGNFDKAIRTYQKAIQIGDDFAEPHFSLSLAYFQQGKLQESLKEVNRAVEIKPDFAPAYYQLAVIYGALGMKEDSLSASNKYLELKPGVPLTKTPGN